MDIAGVYQNYDYSNPAARVFCIFLNSGMFVVFMNGGTACLVVITLDRFWKIVYPVHHRKRYRSWMLYVGLLLPWLSGVSTHFIPNVSTTRNANGTCDKPAFRLKVILMPLCMRLCIE